MLKTSSTKGNVCLITFILMVTLQKFHSQTQKTSPSDLEIKANQRGS